MLIYLSSMESFIRDRNSTFPRTLINFHYSANQYKPHNLRHIRHIIDTFLVNIRKLS